MLDLAALIAANEEAAAAIAASYQMVLDGVPNQAGFTALINNLVATNFGSNNPSIVFNQENKFINVLNALVQGNPDAAAGFAALTAGAASLSDKVAALYNAVVPPSVQSEGGLAYVTRPDALAFYAQVAAERGVAGPDGAAIVALASILNIAYENDLLGVGDSVNDLLAAIKDGSAQLPASGDTFTPIEVADGTKFDGDDFIPGQVTLTVEADTVSGTIFDAPRKFTPGGNDQMNTLNDDDALTGTGAYNVLNFTFVNDADTADNDINPTLKNIQEVNVNVRLDMDGYLDLQDTTGLQEINVNGVDDGLFEAYNIQDGTGGDGKGVRLSVSDSNDEDSHVHFYFVDKALTKDDDVANLTVSNVTLADIYVEGQGSQGFETLNLESTGSANAVGYISAEDLRTANITGDEDLTLGTTEDVTRASGQVEAFHRGAGFSNVAGSLSLVDASGLDAALDISVGGESTASKDGTSGTPVDINIIGTKHDDAIRMLAGIDSKGDKVDGGEGDDTIQVFNSVTKGSVLNVEHLDIRGGNDADALADTIKVDTSLFTGLKDVTVRNEGQVQTIAGNWISAAESLTTHLTNLSADVAKAITVQHSTTGSNGLLQNTIVAQLKTDTAADTVALKIVDQADDEDRGINVDQRFNVVLETAGIENITINDADSESNSVRLGAGLTATDTKGSSMSDITGTLTLTGGVAGTFMNFDTRDAGGFSPPPFGGVYDLDLSGSDADPSAQAPFKGAGGVGPAANALNAGGNTMDWFSGAKFDGSTYLGDIVLRVDTLRNADGVAQPGGGQTLLFGKGNDTVIFDLRNDSTAGLTISDKVTGGDGNDTVLFDGDGVRIVLGASEWANVNGFENIRFVGNGVGATDLNGNGDNTEYGENSQNILLTNDIIARNGVEVAGGRSINIINDNDLTDGVGTLGTSLGFANRGVTIDARGLDEHHTFSFNGAEGLTIETDRFIMADANINGMAVIDGGVMLGALNVASNVASNDILEVRNAAVVTVGDLANMSNIGNIWFTNDTAAVQTSVLQLDNATVDRLVNTSQAASATGVEELTIRAIDNPILPAATTQLNLDASQVTNAFLKLNIAGGGGVDNIIAGAGDDVIDGGAGNDVINGGAGNDIIVGGKGADSLTGAAGADIFRFNQGDSYSVAGQFDTVTDYQDGVDKFDVVGLGLPATVNAPALFANEAALLAAFVPDGSAITANNVWVYQTTTDTYILWDSNGDGTFQRDNPDAGVANDLFVKLVGLHTIDISDFIA